MMKKKNLHKNIGKVFEGILGRIRNEIPRGIPEEILGRISTGFREDLQEETPWRNP